MKISIFAPALAYLLDRALGDPPNRWHPVAWQGRFWRGRKLEAGNWKLEAGGRQMLRFIVNGAQCI